MSGASAAATAQRTLAPEPTPRAHVLQVVLSLTPGGTEHLVMAISRRIRPEFRVTVCCLDDEGAWAPQLRADGIDVVALRRPAGFRPAIGRQIAAVAAGIGADLLHCHQYSPFVYGRIAACWNRRLRVVYTEHGRLSDAPPTWKRRLVNPLLSRFDGAVVAVSDELRDYMVRSRFEPGRVEVIHNGIDPGTAPTPLARGAARRALHLDDDAFVIIAVARLDPVKDFAMLIDAVAMARREIPALHLVIIGDGVERPAIAARAAAPDVAGAVTLAGFRSDVRGLLSAADVYVSSSISEGVSLTILEAMAAGLPVVATAVGGTPEVLGSTGTAGCLVPSRDPVGLAAAVVALARDPERRASLAAAARRRVESAFTVDRMVTDYTRVYRGLLG